MALQDYLRLLRRWWWLISLFAFVGAGGAYILEIRREPEYKASAILSIGRFIASPNPDSSEIRTGMDLVRTYERLATTSSVLQGVIDTLDLPISVGDLRKKVDTDIPSGTSLLVVKVTYKDAILVGDIANALAEQLIIHSPTNLTPAQQAQLAFLETQIQEITQQIEDSRSALDDLNVAYNQANTDAQRERLRGERSLIISQINDAQSTIAQHTNTIASLQERTNALDIVERATIPGSRDAPDLRIHSLLGAAIGAVLAFGVLLVIEYIDDTIGSAEDAIQTLGMPVLGVILRFGKKNQPQREMLLTNYPSISPVTEGYRSARTNLLFTGYRDQRQSFIITSPNPEEGKTVTAANLAVVMSQAGLNVLLIDADLRRPMIHDVFGLNNEIGLTTLLYTDPELPASDEEPFDPFLSADFLQCVQRSDIPNLYIITSGFIPSNPAEVLGSAAMKKWVDAFRAAPTLDVIIIDSPPTLAVADSQILAAATGIDVVFVVRSGHTSHSAATRAKDLFLNLEIEPKGVIVNRVNPRRERYGYYHYGYSSAIEQNVQQTEDKLQVTS